MTMKSAVRVTPLLKRSADCAPTQGQAIAAWPKIVSFDQGMELSYVIAHPTL
jgi:hypothetical protein